MSSTLSEFQRHFPSTIRTVSGAAWTFRDTDQDADRIPLVMLPGAGGTGDVFYRAVEGLRESCRVVTVTYPALDDADKLASGLLEALTEAGINGFDLLGSSLGGYVAQVCALRSPGRVRRCMFANTFFDGGWLQRKISRDNLLATAADTHLANTLKGLQALPDETPEKADFKRTMLALVGTEQSAEMARSALLAVLGTTVLPKVTLRPETIAVLDTEDDPVVDGPTRQAMRERYDDSMQIHLGTGGHYPSLLNPTEFVAASLRHFPGDLG